MAATTLIYERKARKALDGSDGFLFRHQWSTGYQELIFPSHAAAEQWLASTNRPIPKE